METPNECVMDRTDIAIEVVPPKMDHLDIGYINDKHYPLLIQPATADTDLAHWAMDHRQFIDQQLMAHGAILFRGFRVASIPDFESTAQAICPDLYGEYGDLPKEKNGQRVYRSTPYPPDSHILFHNEASHTHRWPLKQFFFCLMPADSGGETPIVDCRRVYQQMDPAVITSFREKQLKYVRNFIPGMDVSWQSFFKTSDKTVVEAHCRENDIGFEWFDNDRLRIEQISDGVAQHPTTEEWVFFNQMQLHHLAFLDPAMREMIESSFAPEHYPRHVCYGDGSPIEDAVAHMILQTYWDNAVSFTWQSGDILMVDNMLIAHARNPYQGKRKIVVAMAEIMASKDIAK